MPRRKQDRPKRMKWEEGSGGGEGKEPSEDDTNTATDNDPHAPPLQQNASDTEDNSGESDSKPRDETTHSGNNGKNGNNGNNCNNSSNACDSRQLKVIVKSENIDATDKPCDSVSSSHTIKSNAKHKSKITKNSNNKDNLYRALQLRLSESGVTASQRQSSPSPPAVQMGTDDVAAPLDFSIKAQKHMPPKPTQNGPIPKDVSSDDTNSTSDAPLDLSLGKRQLTSGITSNKSPITAKVARFDAASPWNYSPHALPSQKHSPSHNDISTLWNGKMKNNILSNKLSSPTLSSTLSSTLSLSSPTPSSPSVRVSSASHSGRQNPWQTQWINRSSEQTRDVFTCVWCKESFRCLAEMTDHMKKSPRCGMAGMQQAATASTHTGGGGAPTGGGAPPSASPHLPSTSSTSPKEPISSSVLAKNNVGLPRKLVRGQDVWLGRGAEQTRQILKCMWCGQSFKTLADMTTHMRVTQHYTNIISQEQIISWRTPEDKLTQAQVNAVLTCKVCDEAFGSLKELSYHMVKNAHYKEHILRSITEGGHGRRRQTRERRKKSLPVRKLLELERRDIKPNDNPNDNDSGSGSATGGQSITCDECHEKVEAKSFISHIKLCKAQVKSSMRSLKTERSPERGKSPSQSSHSGPPSRSQTVSPTDKTHETPECDRKSESDTKNEDSEKETKSTTADESPATGFGSVLNAIERLIEKSFDSKSRKTQSTGILQRLGIDEEVCPPWQHMPHPQWSRNDGGSGSEFYNSGGTHSRSSGRHSSSPLPHEFSKDSNSSICSPNTSDGCDDSNSCNSVTNNNNNNKHIQSITSTDTTKLSFPISSLISENKLSVDNYNRLCRIPSPISEVTSHTGNSKTPSPQPGVSKATIDEKTDVSDNDDERLSPVRGISSPNQMQHEKRKKNSNSPQQKSTAQRTRNKSDGSDNTGIDTDAFHPLMQLQKLLDKTDSGNKNKASAYGGGSIPSIGGVNVPSSLLAFSWACTDAAVAATASSAGTGNNDNERHQKGDQHLMKCAFCETHFISKGAYRHHLSKMHFIKADKHGDFPNSVNHNHTGSENSHRENTGSDSTNVANSTGGSTTETGTVVSESPHSKFLKYTELAKQLSSKYV